MSMRRTGIIMAALLAGCAFGVASAKLPAPSAEQKGKAAEAKDKAAEAAKRETELLGKSQDRSVENFKRGKVQKTGGAAVKK